ncbi:outer membrane beta-barrel protein [Mucilaginibacter sp. BT774]|uniref:outer membrane beta-barrel protein n=1 Tax=Mucilaginibacter sp. BT774 TaxID=3062276 RepID=UPI0026757C9E|nr:outer membrane beta-barrel protein [Mucilaginibacter sp. BT774]MDO3625113.1 TonB-dependent receptor [Mucilaginibacter sp. BT774]
MWFIKKTSCLIILLFGALTGYCQPAKDKASDFVLLVVNEKSQPIDGASVGLLKNDKLVKTTITDSKGTARFENIAEGSYTFSITYTGYKTNRTGVYQLPSDTLNTATIALQPLSSTLNEVNITALKPFIEQKKGKIVLNISSSVTNVGATILEVLEKSPGVTVDRNGGITLQGKTGVLVTIDDKPTYLSGADLNSLLSSMSSTQVEQIELITNRSAKYDASGNAGVINIKTKKNKLKGFNGSVTTSIGQGVYPKNNENLALNYRSGKINTFITYNRNWVKYLLDLYALRKYYDDQGALTAMLQQPSYFKGTFLNNTLKTGLDYEVSSKTTVGLVLGGTFIQRDGANKSTATWLNPAGAADSTIATVNQNNSRFKNGSINLNGKHVLSASQDIGTNFDWLHYSIQTDEDFNNQLQTPNGYNEQSRGNIPTTINIVSGKADYTLKCRENTSYQAGLKSSHSSTDNIASYQNFDGSNWIEDNTKNNHFKYNENINAVYVNIDQKYEHLTLEAGLRYEHTTYHAHQLGNAIQKDSAFSRNYGGLFPSGSVSYQADSSNSFTLTAGRRIDRPVFQTLNPFYFIINKYTYQTGNPYLLPQYSWNLQLSHQYRSLLTTSVSYSIINNYFSQLFLADTARGILLYSQGNVGHTSNIGLSASVVTSLFRWWSLTAQAVYNHKQLAGFNGNNYTTKINQLNISSTSQFIIARAYTAEISGFYTTKARNDIQELLYPTGQLSLGFSKSILKKKGTLKFSARDIFYTNAMEGLTQFPNATEYFKEKRDSRVFTVAFTYRFGKTYKVNTHSEGSATEESDRVGNG